jgi:hypothetical protein
MMQHHLREDDVELKFRVFFLFQVKKEGPYFGVIAFREF